jgi:hypothetical protein
MGLVARLMLTGSQGMDQMRRDGPTMSHAQKVQPSVFRARRQAYHYTHDGKSLPRHADMKDAVASCAIHIIYVQAIPHQTWFMQISQQGLIKEPYCARFVVSFELRGVGILRIRHMT